MTLGREQFRIRCRERVWLLDGAMGTLLQAGGLPAGRPPDELNLTNADAVRAAHAAYVAAGARILLTNTFGATKPRLSSYKLGAKVAEINRAAVAHARAAAGEGVLVAGDLGPLGEYVEPVGKLSFEDAYRAFAEQARVLAAAGVDLIIIETIADVREAKAAVMAARAAFRGAIVACMTFEADGRTITGTPPAVAAAVLTAAGADGVGANCSVGPRELVGIIREMAAVTDAPLCAEPNAGLPRLTGKQTVFKQAPEPFAKWAPELVKAGASIVGGCCGTTPAHIRAVAAAVESLKPLTRTRVYRSVLASRGRLVAVDRGPVIVGERINPSGKPRLATALARGHYGVVAEDARAQVGAGAAIVDVNVGGAPNGPRVMAAAVAAVQQAVDVPVAVDAPKAELLAAGLAAAVGKPLLNSCPATPAAMAKLLPLARKWGAAIVGLPLDAKGVPPKAAGRLALVEKFLERALDEGLPLEDIYIDPLMLTAAHLPPAETFATLRAIKQTFGVRTVLGVSNVSHGLPGREILNEAAFLYALGFGLDLAIVNPLEPRMAEAVAAAGVLAGTADVAAYAERVAGPAQKPAAAPKRAPAGQGAVLYEAIVNGRKDEASRAAAAALRAGSSPLALNDKYLLPALDEVGGRFGRREFFLPQVIRAAEAAQAAFGVLERSLKKGAARSRGRVVLATVAGDVHDIGKNIVAAVLKSHGFEVHDLGKSVPVRRVVEASARYHADLVGLSALMTTTMPEMEAVAAALTRAGYRGKLMVGGAVVTAAYARKIGAHYARDAVDAARVARQLVKS
jgi:5-methyltetrahydrofolate--homocysteine methyltransferase